MGIPILAFLVQGLKIVHSEWNRIPVLMKCPKKKKIRCDPKKLETSAVKHY